MIQEALKQKVIVSTIFTALIALNILPGQKIFETFDHDRKHKYTLTTTYEFDIDTAKPFDFVIENVQGDIYIQGTNSMTVQIEEKVSVKSRSMKKAEEIFKEYKADVTHHSEDNTVEVKGKGNWVPRMSYTYEVSVPTAVSIKAYTSGGDIELSLLTGEMDIKTSGGDIELKHIEGKLTGKTSGGDIELNHCIGNVYLTTSGGDIEVENIEGKLNLHTSGGDIEVSDGQGNVDVSTSGGDIAFTSISGEKVNGRTSGGNVEANDIYGDLVMITSGGDLIAEDIRGTVRGNTSGGNISLDNISGYIQITTNAGSIHCERIQSGVSATTSSGDISIEKTRIGPDVDQSINLNASYGDIYLSLPEDISATIDAIVKQSGSQYAIDTEFPLSVTVESGDVEACGTLGDGKHSIKLRNSYGQIMIERN